MRAFLVVLGLAIAFFVGTVSAGPDGTDYCLHVLNDNHAKIFNVSDMTVAFTGNTTATRKYNYTMNLCHFTPCSSFSNCQICQADLAPAANYCTANTNGVYSALPASYATYTGYQMFMYGDSFACPSNRRRQSTVYVLCNTGVTKFTNLGEPRVCEYEYEIRLARGCDFTPITPVMTYSWQSSSSIQFHMATDSHYSVDFLQITYVVTLNNVQLYSGTSPEIVVNNLPAIQSGTTYAFTIKALYNGISSANVNYPIPPFDGSAEVTPEQVTQNMINVLGDQLSQTGDKLEDALADIESDITVDVINVVKHTDTETVDIRESLRGLFSNLDNQTAYMQRKLDNQTAYIQYKLDNQTAYIQQILSNLNNNISSSVGGISTSSSSGGGALVVIGIVVGLVIGVAATLAVAKFLLKVDFNVSVGHGGGKSSKYNVLGKMSTNDFLDDEEGR